LISSCKESKILFSKGISLLVWGKIIDFLLSSVVYMRLFRLALKKLSFKTLLTPITASTFIISIAPLKTRFFVIFYLGKYRNCFVSEILPRSYCGFNFKALFLFVKSQKFRGILRCHEYLMLIRRHKLTINSTFLN
jgi:hypothetical protein